jgi:hypothetical protein
MRVSRLVRRLMVDPVSRHPEDGPPFERQRAAYSEKILQARRDLLLPVSMQPMVAHADSQTGAHPEQEDRPRKGRPAEGEQRGYHTDMENRECDEISPADLP